MRLDNCFSKCYTVETVLAGHPDKLCDQISDALLDAYLSIDYNSSVAVECMGTGNALFIGGEVSSDASIDVASVARSICNSVGYSAELFVTNKLQKQSGQTRNAVNIKAANDQGIMYGYAIRNMPNSLPAAVYLVNDLARRIDSYRKFCGLFLPDGKVQITFNNGAVSSVVISVQHSSDQDLQFLEESIRRNVLDKIFEPGYELYFNYNSKFYKGGFEIDTGLTGRKIVADTYCGLIPHGGGALSGKDPFKVDRCAAYMTRYVAKNVVENGLAEQCLVSVAYIFGREQPIMLNVETGNKENDAGILSLIKRTFDFRPHAIVELLDLKHTKFLPTATYGHFTCSSYPWEKVVNI